MMKTGSAGLLRAMGVAVCGCLMIVIGMYAMLGAPVEYGVWQFVVFALTGLITVALGCWLIVRAATEME